MRVRPVRAGSALVAGLLLVPIGGVAFAVAPDNAPTAAANASPAPAPEADAAVPAPATASIVPEGVEIVTLSAEIIAESYTLPWHSSGRYTARLTLEDVVGSTSERVPGNGGPIERDRYSGMLPEVEFTAHELNAVQLGVPTFDQDGRLDVDGLVEGINIIRVQAYYQNWGSAGSYLAAGTGRVDITVLDPTTTAAAVSGTVDPPAGPTAPGETVTVTAPPGSFAPGETVTLVIAGSDGQVVVGTPTVAGPDGGVSADYLLPEGTAPGELLLYLEGATGPGPGLRVLVPSPAPAPVPPAVVEDVAVPLPQEPVADASADGAAAASSGAAVAAAGSARGALAVTGSGPAPALAVAAAAVLGGAGLVHLARSSRGRAARP